MVPSTVWVVIPVKEHSTRVPFKNLRTLGDKPLWVWTLDVALGFARRFPMGRTGTTVQIVVDTDSDKVSEHVNLYWSGALALVKAHMRQSGLAQPDVSATEVVADVLSDYDTGPDDAVIMLLPTSPFRNSMDIEAMYMRWKKTPDKSLISVTALEDRKVLSWPGKNENYTYLSNGAVQIARASRVLETYGFWDQGSDAPDVHELPGYRGLDIDTEIDFAVARIIAESLS